MQRATLGRWFRNHFPNLTLFSFFLVCCGPLCAADPPNNISGRWQAFVRNAPDKPPYRVDFEFDVDGELLTGTVTVGNFQPAAGILDGKVSPGHISFHLVRSTNDEKPEKYKVKYLGRIDGATIHFTVQSDLGEPPLKIDATRVSKLDDKPSISITPTVLDFGKQEVCRPSKPKLLTIVNESNQEVSFLTRRAGGDGQFIDAECLKSKERKPGERCASTGPKIEGRLKPGEQLQIEVLYWPVHLNDRHYFGLRVEESLQGQEFDIELLGNPVAEGGCCYYGKVFPMNRNSCKNINGIFDQDPDIAKVKCENFEGEAPAAWVNRECPPIP